MFIVYLMTKSNKIEKFIFCVISPLRHVVFIKENLFLIQKLFILRLLDTIGSQIAFFLNFYRNLPQYPCCSIRATDIKIDK